MIKVKLIYYTCPRSQLLNAVLKSKKESIDPNFANGILKVNYRKKLCLSSRFQESYDHDYYMKKISNYLPGIIIGIETLDKIDKRVSYYQSGTTITLLLTTKSKELIAEKLEKQRMDDERNMKIFIQKINLNIIRRHI